MISGWLSPEDTGPDLLTLACPGCGYGITWHITDPDHSDDKESE